MISSQAYAIGALKYANKTNTVSSWTGLVENLSTVDHTVLVNPSLRKEDLTRILSESLNATPEQKKWLSLIVENRHLYLLPKICAAFKAARQKDLDILPIQITTAHPLSAAQQKSLLLQLQSSGKQTEATFSVRPEIIGGIQIEYGGKLLDRSFASILNQLRTTQQE